ncbi:AraC family transcriptional regulator [uncultured Marivita sp.]|uniref:helix-turn-helix domain-containing protein n=1 Tax=uncultured Marivita sp. TaxID=888080 RepID=UPI0026336712|nr:AraC family transcriptional regulator [uncultured Marivita sp.]
MMKRDRSDTVLQGADDVINHIGTHSRSWLAEKNLRCGRIDAAIWDQGDDTFETPGMNVHFLALCLGGYAETEIDFDQRIGPRRAAVETGSLCYVPSRNQTRMSAKGRFLALHVMIPEAMFDEAIGHASDGHASAGNAAGFINETNVSLRNCALRFAASASKLLAADGLSRTETEWALVTKLVDFARMSDLECRPGATPLQIKLAIDYIETRHAEEFAIEEVAAYCGCPAPVLLASFKEDVGMSISRFCNERRVDRIREALDRDPGLPCETLAARVGLDGCAALDGCFRSVMGIGFEHFRKGSLN